MAKVTIEEISQLTGLSRGTISRALNDRPDISAQTKARVLEACARLNYSPSHAARSLATGRHFALAAIVDDLSAGFSADFLRGVLASAERARYTTNVIELPRGPETAAARLRALATERFDGVLVSATLEDGSIAALQESVGTRPTAATTALGDVPCDLFLPDHAEAGRLAGELALSSSGNALYVRNARAAGAAAHFEGFRAACRERGIDGDARAITVDVSANGLDELGARLDGVRAIVASDDALAVSVMLWCAQRGLQPGRDVAVIGHGNDQIAARVMPSLTTADLAAEEIGRRAAETLIQRLNKVRHDTPQTTNVTPQLIRRESTQCLAGE